MIEAPVPGTCVVVTEISPDDYDPEHVPGDVVCVFNNARNAGDEEVRANDRKERLRAYWYLPKYPFNESHGPKFNGSGYGGTYAKFRLATPEEEAAWRLAGTRARITKEEE